MFLDNALSFNTAVNTVLAIANTTTTSTVIDITGAGCGYSACVNLLYFLWGEAKVSHSRAFSQLGHDAQIKHGVAAKENSPNNTTMRLSTGISVIRMVWIDNDHPGFAISAIADRVA